MNKKFFSLLFGTVAMVSASTFVSCQDYDDEIDDLQTQITKNAETIATLQKLANDGVIITSISQNGSGVSVNTSDGKSYTITNGKDGQNGTNGADGKDGKDADVWTIDADGFWCLNGTKTEYKAVGTDGKDGVNGTNGKDGKDGVYYYPNLDGFFHMVDGAKDTKTNISWKNTQGGMTAVQTADAVTFYNADGSVAAVISTVATLKGLVFEPQLVVDGVNAIQAGALTFNGKTLCTPNVTASYYLNPSIVKEAGLKTETVEYVYLTKDYKKTRAISGISASYKEIKDGKLTVNIDNINGTISEGEKIDLVALQVENKDGEIITSDFETIVSSAIEAEDFFIARKGQLKVHYPGYHGVLNGTPNTETSKGTEITTALTENDPAIAGYIAEQHAKDHKVVTDKNYATDNAAVIEIEYNKTTNISEYIAMCYSDAHADWTAKMAEYKLSFVYNVDPINSYLRQEEGLKETTDQQQFISTEVKDGQLYVTPKTYTLNGEQRSSVGRTPIVNVQLVFDGKTVIKNAYIPLHIVEKAPEIVVIPDTVYVTVNDTIAKPNAQTVNIKVGEFDGWNFDCKDSKPQMITAQQMNELVYSLVNLPSSDFAKQYKAVKSGNAVKGSVIELSENNTSDQGDKSYGLTWTLSNAYMWANAGKSVSDYITFQQIDPIYAPATDKQPKVDTKKDADGKVTITTTNYVYEINNEIKVVLTSGAALKALPAAVDLSTANYDKKADYWKDYNGKNVIEQNIKVPAVGDTNSDNAVFVHDLKDGFWSDPTEAIMNLFKGTPYANFPKDNYIVERVLLGASCEGKALTPADLATVIKIEGDVVTLLETDKAKTLLNTNDLVIEYGYNVTVIAPCDELGTNGDITSVAVTKKTPSFYTKYVKPINFKDENASGAFVDEENAGVLDYTVLKAEAVVAMMDWRGKDVDVTKPETEEAGWLAKYYGVSSKVSLTDDEIIVKYTDKEIKMSDPKNVVFAGIVGVGEYPTNMPAELKAKLAEFETGEYFWYWNNGNKLQNDIKIIFPVVVDYKWGSTTSKITVKVNKTKAIN